MAGTRSRRAQASASPESTNEANDNHNNRDSKPRSSRNSRIPSLTTPEDEISSKNSSVAEKSSTEMDSSITTAKANPTTSEEVSSNTSDSGSAGASDKSSSETSVTSDETLKKTKEELIRTAHDLDAQMQELIKIYKDEKKIFVEKSIHLLDNESHPDWLQRIEELRQKRNDSVKIANERHRLKVESILAEYDFALKNVSDEFQAAEKEIIDEFTTKRKRKTSKDHNDFSGLVRIEQAALGVLAPEKAADKRNASSFTLDQTQIQNDLSAINKMIETSVKSVSNANNEHKIQSAEMAM